MVKLAKPDRTIELPKHGDRISVERFHMSKQNIRADAPFGDSERDKLLIENLRRNGIIEPILARPEANGYGIYAGGRKYHAEIILGCKAFIVGKDVLIKIISDEQAREESFIENIVREEMNPLERARGAQDLINQNMAGLHAEARRLGIAASTLSEWTKILQLTPPMQEAVAKGKIFYKDGLKLAKLNQGEFQEEHLAQVLEQGGRDAYVAEVQKIESGMGKKGLPIGKFRVIRIMYEIAHDMNNYNNIDQLAKAKNMTIEEYAKWRLTEDTKQFL